MHHAVVLCDCHDPVIIHRIDMPAGNPDIGDSTRCPALCSAFLTDSIIDSLASLKLTTMPFCMPSDFEIPTPSMRGQPSPPVSAIIVHTLVVPTFYSGNSGSLHITTCSPACYHSERNNTLFAIAKMNIPFIAQVIDMVLYLLTHLALLGFSFV
jgi:hypothetical protein